MYLVGNSLPLTVTCRPSSWTWCMFHNHVLYQLAKMLLASWFYLLATKYLAISMNMHTLNSTVLPWIVVSVGINICKVVRRELHFPFFTFDSGINLFVSTSMSGQYLSFLRVHVVPSVPVIFFSFCPTSVDRAAVSLLLVW